MKKTLLIILSLALILPMFSFTAFAIPLSAGTAALDAEFNDGAPEGLYDYVDFSPVKGDDDQTKYPIFIWLHGMNSGKFPRAQLQWYEFSNWASDEYQARFENAGGCFLLAVRSNENVNTWEPSMCSKLKATIDYYIYLNRDNVDTNRIYISGYSTGGTMVWDMLSAYSDFFAAALPLASIYQPSPSTLNKLNDVSVWMFSSDNDYYPLSDSADTRVSYEWLADMSSADIRFTYFSEAVFADGSKKYDDSGKLAKDASHYIWEAVTYDMFMADGVTPYAHSTTIDKNGNKVVFNNPEEGVISWLSQQTRENAGNSGGIANFFQTIKRFFKLIFGYIKALFVGMFN